MTINTKNAIIVNCFMFFSCANLGVGPLGNSILTNKHPYPSSIRPHPLSNSQMYFYLILSMYNLFHGPFYPLPCAVDSYEGSPQIMRVISGEMHNSSLSSLMKPDAPPVSQIITVAKSSQVESCLRPQLNSPFALESSQPPIFNEEKRLVTQEELGEGIVDVTTNKYFSKNDNKQEVAHSTPVNYIKSRKTKKVTSEHKETTKRAKVSRMKDQEEVAEVFTHGKDREPELVAARKKRFIVKKVVHRFSAAEDEKLKKLVKIHGEGSWSLIAKEMPGLNRKQIRDRYVNYLKKTRSDTAFTAEEDTTILRLVREKGKYWSYIAEELVGRTPIMVKNRFYSSLLPTLNAKSNHISPISTQKNTKERNKLMRVIKID